jgi:hypothetical protein
MDQGNPSSETCEIIHSPSQQCDAAAKAKLNKSSKVEQKGKLLICAGNRLPGPPLYAATCNNTCRLLHRRRIAAPLIFPSAPRRWEGGAGNGEDEGSSSIRRALHNAWTLRRGTRFVSGCGWKEGEDDAMESSHQREQAAMC